MSDLNNRDRAPVGRAGGAAECNVCIRPPLSAADDVSVLFAYQPRTVICVVCLRAANDALSNLQPM